MIPGKNSEYLESEFWNDRYRKNQENNNQQHREWLGDYKLFCDIFRKHVNRTASILVLGCGDSLFSEHLFDDGFENVQNIDIAPSVIEKMQNHCDKCQKMKWHTMDCRNLTFENEAFDVVIEKATLDVFLVSEKSSWTVSDQAIELLQSVANEITRVLRKNSGQFFSITFSAPHFRQPIYEKIFENTLKTINVQQLGSDFHFFLYHLCNDLSIKSIPYFRYQPPKSSMLIHSEQSNLIEENENFLSNINL